MKNMFCWLPSLSNWRSITPGHGRIRHAQAQHPLCRRGTRRGPAPFDRSIRARRRNGRHTMLAAAPADTMPSALIWTSLPSSLRIPWNGVLKRQAFSRREIGGYDDVLDFLVGQSIDVDVTRQPAQWPMSARASMSFGRSWMEARSLIVSREGLARRGLRRL